MAITYDYITVQASHTGLTPIIEAKQYNSGRGVIVTIPDMELTGKTIKVYVAKPDETEVYDYGSVNSRGQAVVNFTEQMLAAVGDAQMELQIFQGDTLVSTFDMILRVYPALMNKSHITSSDEYLVLQDLINRADALLSGANAGGHNSIYRGKNLGTSVTSEQYAAISAGTFDNLYIGDYWTINGINYRIAAFNYYLGSGNPRCATNHVTIVPDTDIITNKRAMHSTNTTANGYTGTTMYTSAMPAILTKIQNAFGAAHILTHSLNLVAAATDGYPTAREWRNSQVELMTEQNVFGTSTYSVRGSVTGANFQEVDNSQYPLFMLNPYFMRATTGSIWLRTIGSTTGFALVSGYGNISVANATNELGVRPAFSII